MNDNYVFNVNDLSDKYDDPYFYEEYMEFIIYENKNCEDMISSRNCKNSKNCFECYYCENCEDCNHCNLSIGLYCSENIKNYNSESYLMKMNELSLKNNELKELLKLTLNKDQFNLCIIKDYKYLRMKYDNYINNLKYLLKEKLYKYLINFYDVIIKLIIDYKFDINLFPENIINKIKINNIKRCNKN